MTTGSSNNARGRRGHCSALREGVTGRTLCTTLHFSHFSFAAWGAGDATHFHLIPRQKVSAKWSPHSGCYLVFLGPAMFDEVPCEMHLTCVTPPLLGLSEVTTDRAVSHTFFIPHGILQLAISPWHCFLHNSYLYRLGFILSPSHPLIGCFSLCWQKCTR